MSAADVKAIHDAMIPRVARPSKPLPGAITEKLQAQGVRFQARQQKTAARVAAAAGGAKGAPVAAPSRALAPADKPAATMLDRSKAVSVKEARDGTIKVQLAPTPAAMKIAMDAHRGVGPKRGTPAFAAAIAAAMGPAADAALATIAAARPGAKVRVLAGSTEMGVRNVAPSPSAPQRVAPSALPVVAVDAAPAAKPTP